VIVFVFLPIGIILQNKTMKKYIVHWWDFKTGQFQTNCWSKITIKVFTRQANTVSPETNAVEGDSVV
jgi:hypothetical protein